jgi:hypothetical protein
VGFKSIQFLLWAALLLFFQVLMLENISLGGWATPVIYPMLFLILPFRISNWILLILALLYGLLIDMFSNTPGMHAAALVFMVWLRPHIISLTLPRGGIEVDDEPRIGSLGLQWFATYTSILILAHHLALYFMEAFSLVDFLRTVGKALFSSVVSFLLIIILEYIFTPRKSRR